MSIIWRKVWRDLWDSKFRTVLVILSTAVGVFALGFVFGTSDVMSIGMTESHKASLFPHLTFYTGLFDDDVVETIQHESDVADVEGERVTSLRWKLAGDEDWTDGTVTTRDDYKAQRTNLLHLVDGHWPKGRGLAVERLTSQHFHVPMGTEIIVEFGRVQRRLPI